MKKAQNKVISGDYLNGKIKPTLGVLFINLPLAFKAIEVSPRTVETIQLVDSDKSKSTSSVIKRGIVGGVIAGGAGAIVGGMTGKEIGVHYVAIYFKDGKKSLVEVDDDIYRRLLKCSF